MNKKLVLSFFLLIFFVSSCDDTPKSGIIEYRIEYLSDIEDDPLKSLYPEKMTYSFRGNDIQTTFSIAMGLVKLTSISNATEGKVYTLFKNHIGGVYYEEIFGKAILGKDGMHGIKIRTTDDTEVVAGLLCKKTMVSFEDSNGWFEVFHTNELNIRDVNANNPYLGIDGVLMKFRILASGFYMELTADTLMQINVPYEKFVVPKEYEKVSLKTIREYLDRKFM